ncbi:TetR/AcrR family transcriptional regulator [Streptomyces griseoviridis]|nr:TetR family transcriptional regulator [Streptomyces griseoviridis]AZS88891.1 TetR/AcrR family transcriptional regulator [Streptomyces griseoviridis]
MRAEGLRERGKARKREAIVSAAHELFAERGYDAATITDISEKAGVSRRTVTLYFPTKLSIALAHLDAVEERIFSAVREREPGWSVIDALEHWLNEERSHQDELDALTDRMLTLNPQLQAPHQARVAEIVENGARHLAEEMGVPPDARDARLAAAAAAALVSSLGPAPGREDIAAAMTFLRAGISAVSGPDNGAVRADS